VRVSRSHGSSAVDKTQAVDRRALAIVSHHDVARHLGLPSLIDRVLREGGDGSIEVFAFDDVEELDTMAKDEPVLYA
jgi:hypothetical protein